MPNTAGQFRLIYMDDSGSSTSGLVVYSWLECEARSWTQALQSLLDLRRDLYHRYRIPPGYPLHATHFATGRGNPSSDANFNRQKRLRTQVVRHVLAHLASSTPVRIGSVYRATTARRHAYAAHRAQLYQRLIAHLDTRLAEHGEHGLVFTDGNGTDSSYQAAHRALILPRRHLLEDPQFHTKNSLWLQMADLVAWSVYQHLHRSVNRRFAWNWYTDHLCAKDIHGGPLAL